MKIPKNVTTFKTWWEENKEVMSELGVSRHAAKLVWCAGVDAIEDLFTKVYLKGQL